MFLKGLSTGGVPLKFSSWHYYSFPVTGNVLNVSIQERSRSVKAIFGVIRRATEGLGNDSGAMFYNLAQNSVLNTFQFRIGGRYFPASPVQCANAPNGTNGAAEAFLELQKSLNQVGDYRLSTAVNAAKWGKMYRAIPAGPTANFDGATSFCEDDGYSYTYGYDSYGNNNYYVVEKGQSSREGSSYFVMSTDLETSSGVEISGLNAEEQSDISLMVNFDGATNPSGFVLEVYTFYDAMVVLRENNVMELIQ